jgi:hypothetical protein
MHDSAKVSWRSGQEGIPGPEAAASRPGGAQPAKLIRAEKQVGGRPVPDDVFEDVAHRFDIGTIVIDEIAQGAAVASHVTVPQYDGGRSVHSFDTAAAFNAEHLLDLLLTSSQIERLTGVSKVDVMPGPLNARQGILQERQIEARPVERDEALRPGQSIEQRLRILSGNDDFILAIDRETDQGDVVVVAAEAGSLDVEEQDTARLLE